MRKQEIMFIVSVNFAISSTLLCLVFFCRLSFHCLQSLLDSALLPAD